MFRFTFASKRREMGLGGTKAVSLSLAREKARHCRLLLTEGKDQIVNRDAARTTSALSAARLKTFDQCAAAYINAHRGGRKNVKHVAQWESSLANYASPVFGSLPVSDVDTDLVVRVLQPIWANKTETAVRLRGRIECILDWATVSKYRLGENPARWRGHLENLLANPKKIAPVVNFPALPWREIAAFIPELVAREGVAARRAVCDPDRIPVGGGARRHLVRNRFGSKAVDHPGRAHEGKQRTPGSVVHGRHGSSSADATRQRFHFLRPYSRHDTV